MARRQGTAGSGGAGTGLTPLVVVVHHLQQARAVLALAADRDRPVTLRSAPDAAGYAGIGFLHALSKALERDLVIDCGDDAGLVMAALRMGCRDLLFTGRDDTARRLGDMAGQCGARLGLERTAAVELRPDDDEAWAFRAQLQLENRHHDHW